MLVEIDMVKEEEEFGSSHDDEATPEEFEIGLIPRGQMRPPTPALNPQISLAGELKMKIRL